MSSTKFYDNVKKNTVPQENPKKILKNSRKLSASFLFSVVVYFSDSMWISKWFYMWIFPRFLWWFNCVNQYEKKTKVLASLKETLIKDLFPLNSGFNRKITHVKKTQKEKRPGWDITRLTKCMKIHEEQTKKYIREKNEIKRPNSISIRPFAFVTPKNWLIKETVGEKRRQLYFCRNYANSESSQKKMN